MESRRIFIPAERIVSQRESSSANQWEFVGDQHGKQRHFDQAWWLLWQMRVAIDWRTGLWRATTNLHEELSC
jgi:hypothetical protein